MITHKTVSQTVIGVAAVAALALSACSSSGQTAEFEEPETTTQETQEESVETGPQLPEAEAGLVVADISQEAAVLDTLRPENNEIITPAGTLTVQEVEIVESVAATEVDADAGAEQDELGPAAGEAFRILNFSFAPDERTQGYGDDVLDVEADLALNAGGQQQHLSDLDDEEDYRTLVSVPQDDGAQLVVSSQGHDQYIDVLTGERTAEAQDAAATYYRDITSQDLNHAFPIPSDGIPIERTAGSAEQDDAPVDYSLRINSAELTAWSPEDGWAAPGEGWLAIDWSYDIESDLAFYTVSGELQDLDLTLTAELADETLEFNTKNAGGRRSVSDEHLTYLAVPEDIVEADLSLAGGVEFVLDAPNVALAQDGAGSLEVATDPLTVSFPMEGSESADEDDAEDDQDEDDAA